MQVKSTECEEEDDKIQHKSNRSSNGENRETQAGATHRKVAAEKGPEPEEKERSEGKSTQH